MVKERCRFLLEIFVFYLHPWRSRPDPYRSLTRFCVCLLVAVKFVPLFFPPFFLSLKDNEHSKRFKEGVDDFIVKVQRMC